VALGPFDYETPPRTPSLWIAEGLTSWFGDLATARVSERPVAVWLPLISGHLRHLMATPGRAVMTLERASEDVFTTSMSGVMGAPQKTVSYYEKGPVVGLLLDAHLRKHADGKGLDDVMRLAGRRYSGAHGYREEEWEACAAKVAGEDLRPFFDAAVRSTQELDLSEALDWFGLRVRPADAEANGKAAHDRPWTLEVRPDASEAQQQHLAALLRKSPGK
jgi:predicted metalloprotease with PDZ domain